MFVNRWEDHPKRPSNIPNLIGSTIKPVPIDYRDLNCLVEIGITFGNGNMISYRTNAIQNQINKIKKTAVGSGVGLTALGFFFGFIPGLIGAGGGIYTYKKITNLLKKYHSSIFTQIKSRKTGRQTYNYAPNGSTSIYAMRQHAIQKAQKYIYIEDQYLIDVRIAKLLSKQLSMNPNLKIILLTYDSRIDTDLFAPYTLRSRFIRTLTGNFYPIRYPHKQVSFCYRKVDKSHNYVHSKTWIFDDEFAIIGSANCNNRGHTHDSEVAAGIYDTKLKASNGIIGFVQDLRIKLWAEHLRLNYNSLIDPDKSIDFWFGKIPMNSLITPVLYADLIKNDTSLSHPISKYILSTGRINPSGN